MSSLSVFIYKTNYPLNEVMKRALSNYTESVSFINEIPPASFSLENNAHELFVLDYTQIGQGKTSKELISTIGQIKERLKSCTLLLVPFEDFSIVSRDFIESDRLMIFPYNGGIKNLIKKFQLNSNLSNYFLAPHEDNLYYPCLAEQLKNTKSIKHSLYLKYSDQKYTRVYDETLPSSYEVFNKYLEKGEETFYIEEDDYFRHLDDFLLSYENKTKEIKASINSIESLGLKCRESMFRYLSSLNLDTTVINKAKMALDDASSKIEKSAKLFNMIKEINSREDFFAEHCLLLSYITSAMVFELDLKDSYACEKLVIASVLHDVDIPKDLHENSYLAMGVSDDMNIKLHPVRASERLYDIPNVSPDIEKIISQHHERQDGEGYPKGLSFKDIHQLSTIFIVAEDFVNTSYTDNITTASMNKIVSDFSNKYEKGNFRSSYVALCKVISKSQNLLY